jgi:putative sporulation protein YtaF
VLGIILLSLSLSLDSLGAGFTYGMKNIRIPPLSGILFFLTSVVCSLLATTLGHLLSNILPNHIGNLLSSLILLGLGLSMLISSIRESCSAPTPKRKQIHWVWEILGLTITIVRHPAKGDLDASNTIDPSEAIFLGMALSLDSFGVGVGYGLSAATQVLPFLIAASHYLFLSLGQVIGKRLRRSVIGLDALISYLPGIVLMVLGLLHSIKVFW